jgi:hypothetical protein
VRLKGYADPVLCAINVLAAFEKVNKYLTVFTSNLP